MASRAVIAKIGSHNGQKVKPKNNAVGWLFSLPYFILGIVFFLIPLVWVFYLSVLKWNTISPIRTFVGLNNFIGALKSDTVRAAFVNTFIFMLIIVPIVMIFSLLIAIVIHKLPSNLKGIFAVGFFLPYLSSGVASSLVAKGVFSYYSPLNLFLRSIGKNIDWFSTKWPAFLIICFLIVWKMYAYYMLLFLSSLEGIGSDVLDACKIDGAEGFTKLRKIVLPAIYPAIMTVTILACGLAFSIFTEPYKLTNGGPGNSTQTWQLIIYNESFVNMRSGYGAAVALISALLTFAVLLIVKKLIEKWGKVNGWD
jgi:multiple sugar transport system permease protein